MADDELAGSSSLAYLLLVLLAQMVSGSGSMRLVQHTNLYCMLCYDCLKVFNFNFKYGRCDFVELQLVVVLWFVSV